LQCLNAAQYRHVHIKNANVICLVFQLIKRRIAIVDQYNKVAGLGQSSLDYLLIGRVVFGNKYR
jgi:hypothetical protein